MSTLIFLLELALPSGLGLFLALHGRFLIMFSLTELHEDAGFLTRTLKTAESTVDRLVFLHADFCHDYPLPSF